MADALARAKLARLAGFLNSARRAGLPPLILMTDDARLADPGAAARCLPRGSLVIVRARDRERRRALAAQVAGIARLRGLHLSIADDPALAHAADGAHFPEARTGEIAHWRARHAGWFLTASAHSLASVLRAAACGADAVLLSPVFPTGSHPDGPTLGPMRLRLIAAALQVPVYALGGIDAATARRLGGARLAGLAAIGGLTP